MIKTRLINIINDASGANTSNIHFSFGEDNNVRIVLRAGNVMFTRTTIERAEYEKILAYVRFHASLDLADPLQPQAGELVIQDGKVTLSCRVSTFSTSSKFTNLVLQTINTPQEQLVKKVENEHAEFQEGVKQLSKDEILRTENVYEIMVKNEILHYVREGYIDVEVVEVLLEEHGNILDEIYQIYTDIDSTEFFDHIQAAVNNARTKAKTG